MKNKYWILHANGVLSIKEFSRRDAAYDWADYGCGPDVVAILKLKVKG
jgi:hypothetical protein